MIKYSSEDIEIATTRVAHIFICTGDKKYALECGLKVLVNKKGFLEGIHVHFPEKETTEHKTFTEYVITDILWDLTSFRLRDLKDVLWSEAEEKVEFFDLETFNEDMSTLQKMCFNSEDCKIAAKHIIKTYELVAVEEVLCALTHRLSLKQG